MRRGALALFFLAIAGGCAGPPAALTPGTAPGALASATPPAPASASPPSASPPSASPASPPSASPAGPASIDPGLLALLPAAVDGRPIIETPDAEAAGASDPSIAGAAGRLAMAYVESAGGADWAIMSVVALRPGVWNEAFFRDWRDTYDAGVCGSHGGVGGNASATIAGRVVYITTCGPIRTYHVHLTGPDVVVSVAAVGDARYGERVMGGLRP